MLKKNSITFLQLLKFLILEKDKGHHPCLKVFNTEKLLHHFLMTLKIFNIEKGLHHFLETLKSFNFEKWLHHIFMTLKVFQNRYSVECRWTAASEGRLLYHIILYYMHKEYIFLLGQNFPGMRGLILVSMSNVCYLAVILNFFVVTW